MQKWEYLGVHVSVGLFIDEVQVVHVNEKLLFDFRINKNQKFILSTYFTRLGLDGWEMVSFGMLEHEMNFYFKRPIE